MLLSIVFAVACGGSSNNTIDAPPSIDAASAIDAPVGPSITISGTVLVVGLAGAVPTAGYTVGAYASSNEATPVVSTTSANDGTYSLKVPLAAGASLDGFLKGTKAGSPDAYLYTPTPVTANYTNATINTVDMTIYGILAGPTIGNVPAGQGMVVLEVVDSVAALTPIAGVAVTSLPQPGVTGYSQVGSPLPNTAGAMTIADGRAYLFGFAPGSVTISAKKTGSTFKDTTIKVHADAFTTTLVTQ